MSQRSSCAQKPQHPDSAGPLRVAILMPLADQRGGAEELLRILMREAGRSNDAITWSVIFLQDGPLRDEFEAWGIPTRVVVAGRLRQLWQYMRTVREIAALLEAYQTDIVFSWMAKAHLYGAVAARMADVPAVWYQHGLPHPRNAMERLTTWLPTQRVAACSQMVAAAQRALRPERPTSVVHPCVDLRRFDAGHLPSPEEARHRLGLPTAVPIVGIVGRLQRWKGIHVFVEAMALVRDRCPDAYGVIVGGAHDLEPDYADEVEHRIKVLGLSGHIALAGYQKNVPEWMQAMDVVVHASDREPFGMVIVEAMALGKPVVAGAEGGPREIISDGETGLLAAYGDAEQLAGRILRYLDDATLRHRIGNAARARARHFSPERYVENVVGMLRSTQLESA